MYFHIENPQVSPQKKTQSTEVLLLDPQLRPAVGRAGQIGIMGEARCHQKDWNVLECDGILGKMFTL